MSKKTNYINVVCPKCKGSRFQKKCRPCSKCQGSGSILVDENKTTDEDKNLKSVRMNMVRKKSDSVEVKIPVDGKL